MLSPFDVYQGLANEQVNQQAFRVLVDAFHFNVWPIKAIVNAVIILLRLILIVLEFDLILVQLECRGLFLGQSFLELLDQFLYSFGS